MNGLQRLAKSSAGEIKEIRGLGMMAALSCANRRRSGRSGSARKRLLVNAIGSIPSVFCRPLSPARRSWEALKILEAVLGGLEEDTKRPSHLGA